MEMYGLTRNFETRLNDFYWFDNDRISYRFVDIEVVEMNFGQRIAND